LRRGGPSGVDIAGLPSGANIVRVGWDIPEGRAYGETTFEMKESFEKVTVELAVLKGVMFVARLVIEKPDGLLEPLPSIRIQIDSEPSFFPSPLTALTSLDGTVSFGSTPKGVYHLAISGLPENMYITRTQQDGRDISARTFAINGETHIDIVARGGGGTIEGSVRDAHGNTVQGAMVALIPADPMVRSQFELYRTATSDQVGKFTQRNVAPGSYKMLAWIESAGLGPFFNSEFIAKHERHGSEIQIVEGQSAVVDILLADDEKP
jgi:hypothetical protein